MKLKKKGFSAMLSGSTIDLIKSRAATDGVSQATIIETAIDSYCNETPNENRNRSNSDTSFYQKEFELKNNHIDRLLTTIDQQNQLLGMASKKELLLIEEQIPVKKKQDKKAKEADILPKEELKASKKVGKKGRSKSKKKKHK